MRIRNIYIPFLIRLTYLKNIVRKIVKAIYNVNNKLKKNYPLFDYNMSKNCYFIISEKLRQLYPNISPKEREYKITKEHKVVFIMQIGKKLKDKSIHDFRVPDYDDWNFNGDLLMYQDVLDIALEMSSMGVRVDKNSLIKQLETKGLSERLNYEYHKNIINSIYPQTIGGGIGQSRLCLLLMQ